jgi:prevent-host-death family protein
MAKQVNVHDAKTHFSKLIAQVEAGEEIVIARAGKPILKLVKIEPQLPQLVPGFAKDAFPGWDEDEWEALDKEFNSLFRDKSFDL